MSDFFTISLIILLAVISPGPDFALVSRNSLRYSQTVGIMTSLGIGFGSLFHATYCILGLAIIISKSLLLFNIIKYVGAIYLIYLGGKGLLEKRTAVRFDDQKYKKSISSLSAFSQGLLCNVLNLKAAFFFIALFTTFIKPGLPLVVQAGYMLVIFLIPLLWFTFIAVMFSHHKVKVFLGRFQYYITKVFGAFLVFFGLKIAAMSRVVYE
jgi:RhtB (resistance to homoserine/threonine) family protein